jgi:hypothetical protein
MIVPPWLARALDRCSSYALDNQADREAAAAVILQELHADRTDAAVQAHADLAPLRSDRK